PAQPLAQRLVALGERLAQLAALAGERGHQLDKALLGGIARDDRQRLRQPAVIPATAGIYRGTAERVDEWIPAFAGMTTKGGGVRPGGDDDRLGGFGEGLAGAA